MFKVNNKTSEQRCWRPTGVIIVKFEHISHLVLVFLLLFWTKKLPAALLQKRHSYKSDFFDVFCKTFA